MSFHQSTIERKTKIEKEEMRKRRKIILLNKSVFLSANVPLSACDLLKCLQFSSETWNNLQLHLASGWKSKGRGKKKNVLRISETLSRLAQVGVTRVSAKEKDLRCASRSKWQPAQRKQKRRRRRSLLLWRQINSLSVSVAWANWRVLTANGKSCLVSSAKSL